MTMNYCATGDETDGNQIFPEGTLRDEESEFGDGRESTYSSKGRSVHHDEPEVDYEDGATDLYRCIEGKDWDGAMMALETDPSQARTWIYRKQHNSTSLRWRLLPIHATCIFRSPLALIETLIAANSDGPQMKDDQGMLPVHLACRNGASKGVVSILLNAFPECLSVKDRKGRTPLDHVKASSSQNKEAVIQAIKRFQQELSSGFGVRSIMNSIMVPKSINSPAPEVDYEHRTMLFRLLLKKDWTACIARANNFPEEASTWIVTKGFNGNLRFLPIHKACVLSPPETLVEVLIAANIEGAKSRDQDGWLPIHCACFYGASLAVINTLLVAHPKGVQFKDDEGRLPLHYACLKNSPKEIITSLLQCFPKGAISKDNEGRLPLHHACSKGAPENIINELLKASSKGAQSKDDQGRLPLHHACRKGASESVICKLLSVFPKAAQIKDDEDKLPIHYACQDSCEPEILRMLLSSYPESINIKNGFGYTPLAEARSVDKPKMQPIIKILESFKYEQDQIKVESGENLVFEAKLTEMNERIEKLESIILSIANLGRELQSNTKKVKDPQMMLSEFADKLAVVDVGIHQLSSPKKKGKFGGLRALRNGKSKKG